MIRPLAFALLAAATAGFAHAQSGSSRFAVGVQGGTTGIGVEGQFQATDLLTLRAAGDVFTYEDEFSTPEIRYNAEADAGTVSAFLDLHPFRNGFFVSGGGFFGERSIQLAGTTSREGRLLEQTFTPEQFGRLVGEAEFGAAAPFVGLGYNNTFRTQGPIGFKVLVGVAFNVDEPSVTLRREGGVPLSPELQAEFDVEREQQESELEEDVNSFNSVPVVQLGLTYRF